MSVYRYHESKLNASQRKLYELIYKQINSCGALVRLPLIHANELAKIFQALLLDNPEFFYVNSYQYMRDLNKNELQFKPDYQFDKGQVRRFKEAVTSSLSFVESGRQKDDFDKVLFTHDYIADNITYDYSFSPNSYTVLGIAENKSAVCEGIAKYVKLALDSLSVENCVVKGRAVSPALDGNSAEDHAWNAVKVDGYWYHLDVTFDLTLKHKENRYDYFCLSDSAVKEDHIIMSDAPECSNELNEYYALSGLYFENFAQLESRIFNTLRSGRKSMQFKLKDRGNIEDTVDKVTDIALAQAQRVMPGDVSAQVRYNPVLWVFEIEFHS